MDLDEIVRRLEKHQQRATYGAVAPNTPNKPQPQSLMNRRPKSPRDSWVVNGKTGLPSGYASAEIAPGVRQKQGRVISSPDDLATWLGRNK